MVIYSPIVSGSGAIIVHKQLAAAIDGYKVKPINPLIGMVPQLMWRFRPNSDIVHTSPELAEYIRLARSKLITTFHNFYLDNFILNQSSRAQRFYYTGIMAGAVRKSIKRSDRITVVSDATASLVYDFFPSVKRKLVVIKNGVDENLFKPDPAKDIKSDVFNVLFVGNPSSRKGAIVLNELAGNLPDKIKLICLLGLRNKNPYLDPQKVKIFKSIAHADTPAIYNQSHVLLFPSVREGLSLVVLEAMACGLPVVTYNISSMPEQIDDGKGGYLCSIDRTDDLYGSILHLYKNRNLIEDMGAYNREKILANFRLSRTVEKYRELFKETVSG